LIGEYRDGKFYHIKRLIAGLNQFNRPEIFKAVQDLKTNKGPFVNLSENKSHHQHAVTEEVMNQVQWLKPEQPAEVEFVERTPHGRLRHASFRRLLPRSGDNSPDFRLNLRRRLRMPEILRTPELRFENIPGFPFLPHYIDDLPGYEQIRIHYVDEGASKANQIFLCLHGEPTWSYLYRKMIPVFVAAGHRVVAPDFIGFGRSDKPVDESKYTFSFHREMLLRFIERLDLMNVTLVCQDWGGLLGLTLPMELPTRIKRILSMNTALATGDMPLGRGFLEWRAWVAQNPDMDVAKLMVRACPGLSAAESSAYAAPFPDVRYKAGVRRFPQMVPDHPDADGAEISRKAREWLRYEWTGQTFMAVGMQDPVLGPAAMAYLRQQIRNCPPPLEVSEAGHFVQEWGEEIATQALRAFA
jgi:haloalkane dehalogenase